MQDRVCQLNAAPPLERFKKLVLSYSLDTHSKLDLTQATFDILGYLAFHYGFVPPLPLQSKSPVDPKDWETNIKNIGLDIHKNPPSADFSEPIVSFLKGFLWAAGSSQKLWDLCSGNQRKVDTSCLTQIILKKCDGLFFLAPPSLLDESQCPWIIALTTAADALFVYCLLLEKDFSAILLRHILVDEGIRFRTLEPLPNLSIPPSIKNVHAVIPIRIKDYSFKVSDYHSYVQERARLLSSPQGHAALLTLAHRIIGEFLICICMAYLTRNCIVIFF